MIAYDKTLDLSGQQMPAGINLADLQNPGLD